MSATQSPTMVEYLSSLVDHDPRDSDRGTVEGQVEARTSEAQRQYQAAREAVAEQLASGESVVWVLQQRMERVVEAETLAVMWTRAHETSLVAAVYQAAQMLTRESRSTSDVHNVTERLQRDAARRFLSDAVYAAMPDKAVEDALRAEVGKVFMR